MNDKLLLDALVFAPHPDDAELAMGGTILKMIARGKKVGVVDLTRGELGSKGTADIRAEEAAEATRVLGLHYRSNLNLGDGQIADTHENRLKAANVIREFCSPLLFVCPPFDPHPDHQAAAKVVQAAFFLARLPKLELDFPAFSPRHCWYYFIHEMREISFAVDISEQFQRKKEAMRAYKSQFVDVKLPEGYRHVGTSNYLEQIEAYNRTIGAKIGTTYAEGFYSASPLPVGVPTDLLNL